MSNEEKILQILTQMQNDITTLKEGQTKLESRFDTLESKVNTLELVPNEIKSSVNELHKKHDNIIKDVSNEFVQLTKYLDNIESKVDALSEDFHIVAQISAKNYSDIIKIKNIKY